jgi:hypothetical protein
MAKGLFALLLAGHLMIPLTAAFGDEITVGVGSPNQSLSDAAPDLAALPPIPYANEMPWLTSPSPLLGPSLNVFGPFLLAPISPPESFPPTFADRFPSWLSDPHLETK